MSNKNMYYFKYLKVLFHLEKALSIFYKNLINYT